MLNIRHAAEGETTDRTGEPIFQGTVHAQPYIEPGESEHLTAAVVHFSPGARTRTHRHTSDQLLIVTSGIGKVGDADGEYVVASGDSVLIPAGHDHWHGAGDTGSPMSHITVQQAGSQTTILED